MIKKRIEDKTELESLIDEYSIKDIPLSFLLEIYDFSYPQIQDLYDITMLKQRSVYRDFSDILEIPEHKEFGEYPISFEEEQKLFTRLTYLRKQKSKKDIDSTKRTELEKSYEQLCEYILSNKKQLISWTIKELFRKTKLPKEEMALYGAEGLIAALNKYKPNSEYTFTSYAISHIYNSIITNFKELSGLPWIKYLRLEQLKYHKDTERKRVSVLNEESDKVCLSDPFLSSSPNAARCQIRGIMEETIPISSLTKEEIKNLSTNGVMLKDDVTNKVFSIILKEMVDKTIENLTEREMEILKMRFGLNDGRMYTLEETANKYRVSRERVRQVESKALRQLRHPDYSNPIRIFLDASTYDRRPPKYNNPKVTRKYLEVIKALCAHNTPEEILKYLKLNATTETKWDRDTINEIILNMKKILELEGTTDGYHIFSYKSGMKVFYGLITSTINSSVTFDAIKYICKNAETIEPHLDRYISSYIMTGPILKK